MRRYSRRQDARLALAVATIAVCLPELAFAQQTGLFPLAPIRRQRTPCEAEDPIYKEYKQKYFGYHPTCWRTFPTGWGCPSPERPDVKKAFEKQPLEGEGMPTEIPGAQPPGETRPGGLPPIPGTERSPFLLDRPDNPPGAAPGAAPGRPAPRPAPPVDDPFTTPDQGPGAGQPGGGAAAQPPQASRNNGGPNLTPPADGAAQEGGPRAARDDLGDDPPAEAADAPLLALPNINIPPADDPSSIFEPKSVVPGGSPAGATADTAAAPAQPQQPRRGLLSGLFSSLGLNWTRR
jgi:hypothetical protein